jgi:hypothetical protein
MGNKGLEIKKSPSASSGIIRFGLGFKITFSFPLSASKI